MVEIEDRYPTLKSWQNFRRSTNWIRVESNAKEKQCNMVANQLHSRYRPTLNTDHNAAL